MNQKNLDYLKNGLQYSGFGDRLHQELERNVQQQLPAFQLKTELPFYQAAVSYTLHFRKSDQTDTYFFNKYDATLKTDKTDQEKSQTFYINQNAGITAREAFNLLSGRAVHKELTNATGQPYKAWVQLEPDSQGEGGKTRLRQFHENYGYELEKTLRPYAIREFHDPQQKEQLLRSLQRGNVQQVTVLLDGQEVKRFIEASPQYKTINAYDEKLRPVKRETLLRPESQQAPSAKQRQQEQQKGEKQAQSPEGEPVPKQTRRKGMAL